MNGNDTCPDCGNKRDWKACSENTWVLYCSVCERAEYYDHTTRIPIPYEPPKKNICKKCGECCKEVTFTFLGRMNYAEVEFYAARNLKVISLSGTETRPEQFTVCVPHRCPHLGEDNLCDLHGTGLKPIACQNWGENLGGSQHLLEPGCAYRRVPHGER